MNELRVVSNQDEYLALNAELMECLGVADDDLEGNDEYLGSGGDYWIDSDKVKVGDTICLWNYSSINPTNINPDGICYAVCAFELGEYPEHVELIKKFHKTYSDSMDWSEDATGAFRCDDTWNAFYAAESAIAYRGGQGYCYGIYIENKMEGITNGA